MKSVLAGPVLWMLALCVVARVNAQSTWKGLQFGMAETEVAKVLGGTLTAPDPDPEPDPTGAVRRLESHPTAEVKSEKHVVSVMFRPLLDFDRQSGGLRKIHLEFDAIKPAGDNWMGQNVALKTATQDLQSILSDAYGSPVTDSGQCVLDSQDLVAIAVGERSKLTVFKCDKSWKSEGQVVTFHFWYSPGDSKLLLSIEYRPTPKQL